GHPDAGTFAHRAKRKLVRKTDLSLLPNRLDKPRRDGTWLRWRTGGCGDPCRGTERWPRPRGKKLALGTGGGYLCDASTAAEDFSDAGAVTHHDGRTLSPLRNTGADRIAARPEVAKRSDAERQKAGRNPDRDACRHIV